MNRTLIALIAALVLITGCGEQQAASDHRNVDFSRVTRECLSLRRPLMEQLAAAIEGEKDVTQPMTQLLTRFDQHLATLREIDAGTSGATQEKSTVLQALNDLRDDFGNWKALLEESRRLRSEGVMHASQVLQEQVAAAEAAAAAGAAAPPRPELLAADLEAQTRDLAREPLVRCEIQTAQQKDRILTALPAIDRLR